MSNISHSLRYNSLWDKLKYNQAKNMHSAAPVIISGQQEQENDETLKYISDKHTKENVTHKILKVTKTEEGKMKVLCSNRKELKW